ncbi:MAG: gliding motility-associated C-terminal domain-containing protein [Bacteroidetes bacterium]|nr:gliding motility-associated C-terminal domain-containing protein [Bacteroidota bacterium]
MTHNFKISLIISFLLLFFFSGKAQFPNPSNFNTATNATNTGTLPIGATDLNWTAALTNSLGPYVSAVSCANQAPCCWVNSPFANANWISYPHTCSPTDPADHSCLPGNQDIYYKLTFNLPPTACGQSIATPSTYCLSFDFYSDNCVYEIFVNGIINYTSPSTNSYYNSGYNSFGGVSKSLCNNWQSGSNSVIIHVRSGQNPPPTWEALLAQANQTLNTTVGVPFSGSVSASNVSCNGLSNGSATVTTTGSSAPNTYTWLPSGGNSNVANGLTASNYSVIVSSGNCSITKTLTITQPSPFSITVSPNTTICPGAFASIGASGAASYSWNTSATSASITVNSPGIYTVTGTNASGCINTKTVSVNAGPSPTVTITGNNTICVGSSATLTANGANTYTWNTGSQANTIIVSPPGTTQYIVSGNATGIQCLATQTITVTVNNFIPITITGPGTVCAGGQVTLTGNGANTYTWNNGSNSASINVTPLVTSSYTLSGSNLTGCNGTTTIIVNVIPYPVLSVTSASLCPNQSTVVTASGANSYTWNTGALTATTTISTAGTYSVSGANSNGCTSTQTVSVGSLNPPNITIGGLSQVCYGQNLLLSAGGANSYTWSSGNVSSSITIPNIVSSSLYSVTGTDNSTGCANSQTFAVTVNPLPVLTISGNPVVCSGNPANISAGGADTYSWSTGAITSAVSLTPATTSGYFVIGTNTLSGCTNSQVVTVTVSAMPSLSVNNGTVCRGQSLLLSASGSSSYLWSNGAGTSTVLVSPIVSTVYTVTGYGTSTACSITNTVLATVLLAPQITINPNSVSICKGTGTQLSASGFTNYLWNTGETTSQISVFPQGTTNYNVSSTEISTGCTTTKTVQVQVYELPAVQILGDSTKCDGERITLTGSGATSYTWQSGVTTPSIEIVVEENFLYVLSGYNSETGCSNLDSIRVGKSENCCEVFIPNSFTPNEDNMNEDFGPITLCEFKEYKMYIFDKWGEQIFVCDNVKTKWTGYYKGVLCKPDVYVYLIRAKRKGNGGVKPFFEKTGHVSLIR